jgi:diguanylate cyclase (GGDEF)-like protein/PAS domain S-box-containing protein
LQRPPDAALGRDREDLLARTFQDLTHPDDLDTDLELLEQTLAGDQASYAMEKRYLRPNGEVVWASLTVGLVRDEQDEPLVFVSQFEDITARKAAEADLDRARARTRRVLDRAAVAMAILEADGRVTECNHRFRAVFPSVESAEGSIEDSLDGSSVVTFEQLVHADTVDTIGADLALGDGSQRIIHMLVTADEDGSRILQATDVTAERDERRQLLDLAHRDPLTGLANRRGLATAVERMGANASVAVLFLDLDGFKAVNDTLGHDQGDRVLAEVAALTIELVRDVDVPARLGGDEFAVIISDSDKLIAATVARRLIERIEAIPIHGLTLTASVGIASGQAHALVELLDAADRAMLDAKNRGKNQLVIAGTPD